MILFFATLFVAFGSTWQQPSQEILDVLHAPGLPWVWSNPDGSHLLLAQPVQYPPLADRAATMHELAGIRVDPTTNGFHGDSSATSPKVLATESGAAPIDLGLPEGLRLIDVDWAVDGRRFALTVLGKDHIGLWVGDVDGTLDEIPDLQLNPLLHSTVSWMPDQQRLVVKSVAKRDAPPKPPIIPAGPTIKEGDGGSARSTYEARNLLRTAYDEALFTYYCTSQIALVDAKAKTVENVGQPDVYSSVSASPDGKYFLVEHLMPPWSHDTAWWRFGHDIEIWTVNGDKKATVASLPLANEVPIHGVPEGPRSASWRATANAALIWLEALDGGNPINEATHRDKMMSLKAPFAGEPSEIFRAAHRIYGWNWTPKGGTAVVYQRERERRWRHVWLVDVDKGAKSARAWFDLSENDRYNDPGHAITAPLPNGRWVLRQEGNDVFFSGSGATPEGDRPFLDRRSMSTGDVQRLFRSTDDTHERFVAFAGKGSSSFLINRQSSTEVPNYHLVALGEPIKADEGEAVFSRTDRPVTTFVDPTPQLRKITKQIIKYDRKDGVSLSFQLYLPPDYEQGTALPTVLYAYPREFSDPETAGQVSGSSNTFTQFRGPSHLFFLLEGFAVLDRTTMPVLGDPETAYDTFVEQLIDDAEAAIAKAVELGVTDPERVGVTGHSHGGLMTVTLLAHSDLFKAGIARSGAYNHTIRPFGFQSERRTLWEARDTYLNLSPTMFAPQINEPMLLIHGAIDDNPGTVPLQSERLFDAVRGSGGTVRLVMLPFEGHGYRARESVEHVLWEQIAWFNTHVKEASPQD